MGSELASEWSVALLLSNGGVEKTSQCAEEMLSQRLSENSPTFDKDNSDLNESEAWL